MFLHIFPVKLELLLYTKFRIRGKKREGEEEKEGSGLKSLRKHVFSPRELAPGWRALNTSADPGHSEIHSGGRKPLSRATRDTAKEVGKESKGRNLFSSAVEERPFNLNAIPR